MEKKNVPDIIITELFLVKADWTRTYLGEIRRELDSDGNPVLIGKVTVVEGFILCISPDGKEGELRKNMDEICITKLDMGLHTFPSSTVIISGLEYNLN